MTYKGRSKLSIEKLKLRSYKNIGDPTYLKRRRELHRLDPRKKMFWAAKKRAFNKNIIFTINSYRDIPRCDKNCPVLGIRMKVNGGDSSPTLDRIDNNKGYIKGNLRIISRKANQSKSNLSSNEAYKVYEYIKQGESK